MPTNGKHGGLWNDQVWQKIDAAVRETVTAIRTAQRVFSTTQLPDVTSIPADIYHIPEMRITEGVTKPYIEISVEFSLTNGQVTGDPNGSTAQTLATLAAKSLALVEDHIFYRGLEGELPASVKIESGRESIGDGLVGLAPHDRAITIGPPETSVPTNSGAGIFAAVVQGISLLTRELQAPDFALILDTAAYSVTWGSVLNGAPTGDALSQLVTGGIYSTGAMPPHTGLLVALGGSPTTIYFSDYPRTELTHRDRDGKFNFRVFERVQLVARDRRAFC
jgi:uncharacterized linocin/CFP29 family protein